MPLQQWQSSTNKLQQAAAAAATIINSRHRTHIVRSSHKQLCLLKQLKHGSHIVADCCLAATPSAACARKQLRRPRLAHSARGCQLLSWCSTGMMSYWAPPSLLPAVVCRLDLTSVMRLQDCTHFAKKRQKVLTMPWLRLVLPVSSMGLHRYCEGFCLLSRGAPLPPLGPNCLPDQMLTAPDCSLIDS
jgi:hypothetical protein